MAITYNVLTSKSYPILPENGSCRKTKLSCLLGMPVYPQKMSGKKDRNNKKRERRESLGIVSKKKENLSLTELYDPLTFSREEGLAEGRIGSVEKQQRALEKEKKKREKERKKRYERYAARFTPGTKWVRNGARAFLTGGGVCLGAYLLQKQLQQGLGLEEKTAGTLVTVSLIFLAQFLTGLGVFDRLCRFAGAGVIVPITGFANSMVATAMEFKYEGPVLGVGSKMFTLAGPVLVCGISVSILTGMICWGLERFL